MERTLGFLLRISSQLALGQFYPFLGISPISASDIVYRTWGIRIYSNLLIYSGSLGSSRLRRGGLGPWPL